VAVAADEAAMGAAAVAGPAVEEIVVLAGN
jgi:hypothetical protein